MHLVYPADYFKPYQVDSHYAEEAQAFKAYGVSTWDGQQLRPAPPAGKRLFYRGWMLTVADYTQLYGQWAVQGHMLKTSPEHYALCHMLPNWYHSLQEHTPETHFVTADSSPIETLQNTLELLFKAGWQKAFLKDAVKSLKTAGGSVLNNAEDARRWFKEMQQFRQQIEWPICIREWEDWQPETERRYFVYKEQILSPIGDPTKENIPEPVKAAQAKIDSPFFSVDVVLNTNNTWRLVEIGDGQVSDLVTDAVGWTPQGFAEQIARVF